MAIIKPVNYKGLYPYWWEVSKVEEDRVNDTSRVTLSLYASSESCLQDKANNKIYDVAVDLQGTMLSNESICEQAITKDRFIDGVDAGVYNTNTFTSPVWVNDLNPDPKNGLKRAIEGLYYTTYLNAMILVLVMRVHFYPNIQVPNPEFVEELDEENNITNESERYLTISSDVCDPKLDKDVAWVVDDFYEVAPGVGELTYFKSVQANNGLTDEQTITQGIGYGLSKGYIYKRLYGNV